MEDDSRLLSVKEGAARLGVCYDSMRTYLIKGIVKARKIGGRWYINPKALEVADGRGDSE